MINGLRGTNEGLEKALDETISQFGEEYGKAVEMTDQALQEYFKTISPAETD